MYTQTLIPIFQTLLANNCAVITNPVHKTYDVNAYMRSCVLQSVHLLFI
jgi:hypothetical protein